MQDPYYHRREISNSDLSALKRALYPIEGYKAPVAAYRFGRLIDYMLTEQDKLDHLHLTAAGEAYTREEWYTAKAMRQAFLRDETGYRMYNLCKGQTVMTKALQMEAYGVDFTLNVRCKYDFWSELMGWGADLKSTTATSQLQFEQAAEHFDYDRQRAFYMDISGADKDILIGVSKAKPHNVFKIYITRDSEFYKRGRAKYLDLAFRWFSLFGNNPHKFEEE